MAMLKETSMLYDEKQENAQIRIVFKVSREEYDRAKPFIGDDKYRNYFAWNAWKEKVSRMEANDKSARLQRMKTDATYINNLINEGLIKVGSEK
jgi:hypothetical protein